MIQIVGLIGCFYLFVKCLEIFGNQSFRQEDGKLNEASNAAAVLAGFGSIAFALWLLVQGGAFHYEPAPDPNINVDANLTTTDDNAVADPDAALNAAGADVANADAALNAAN